MKNPSDEHLWNKCNLKPPQIHFENNLLPTRKIIKKAIMNELSLNTFRNQIYTEILTLSKFLSQRKNKYRSDKGFKTIQKIYKAINRIYQLDLHSTFSLIKLNLVDTFVPSKQVQEWLLIKLQSYSKLLYRVNSCSCYSAAMLNHRLRTGHNWVEIMITLSMVSRIWAISKFLMKRVSSTYQQLLSVLDQLPIDHSEREWHLYDYKFPENLENWMSSTDCDELLNEPIPNKKEVIRDLKKQDPQRKIMKIKTHQQLKKFVACETRKRAQSETTLTCISKNLDALQWHMFTKKVLKWIKILKKSDTQRQTKLLKIIKSKLRTWLL